MLEEKVVSKSEAVIVRILPFISNKKLSSIGSVFEALIMSINTYYVCNGVVIFRPQHQLLYGHLRSKGNYKVNVFIK